MLPPIRLFSVKRRPLVLTLLSALAALFLIGCAFLTLQVYVRLDEMTAARSDDMQFTISRVEVEYVKLQSAVRRLEDPDPEAVKTFRRSFDALYSRVNTLLTSPLYADALGASGMRDDLEHVRQSLDEMIFFVDRSDTALTAAAPDLLAGIAPLLEPVQRISLAAVDIDAERTEVERQALARTLLQLAVISGLLLIALVALLFQVWTLFTRYRKRAKENRVTLRRLSTILNTSLDHILVVDPLDRIIEANAAADTAFGLAKREGGRKPVTDVIFRRNDSGPPEPVSGTRLIEACRNGPNRCANVLARRADGTMFPVEMSAALAVQSNREVCVCYLRDISQRLKSQQEVEDARDRALAGEQAKARFLGMISHEMRTPLNGILGTVDLLDDTELSAEQTRYARILQSAGQQLLTQINDALDLTQASAGRLSLTSNRFDLDALLEEAASGLAPQARANGTTLSVRIPDAPLGPVEGDRARVLQVLVNLMSNAVKFTENGEITVEAVRPDPTLPWIEVQVADTGSGVPETDLPYIFEDFVRAANTSDGTVPGSGLGLGIARSLVRAMGGSIGAESIENEGSLFWLRLPLPAAIEQPEGREVQRPTGPVQPLPRALRILVVEDNEANRFVISQMLLKDGHRVTEAADGETALGLAQTTHFDLIIMDIRMPGLDGLETARRIRATPGPARDARLVFLTAHIQSDNPACFSALNAEAVLSKPLRRAVLRDVLAGRLVADVPLKRQAVALDPRVIDQLRETLPAKNFDDLLVRFLDEGEAFVGRLDALRNTLKTNAIPDLHNFAGSAATFGASRLQAQLGQIEAALSEGDERLARAMLDGVPELWSETRDHLTGMRNAA